MPGRSARSDAVKRQIPRRVPRIFPFVRHRDDVGVAQMPPVGIRARACGRRAAPAAAGSPFSQRVHVVACRTASTTTCPRAPDAARAAHPRRQFPCCNRHRTHRPRPCGRRTTASKSCERVARCFGLDASGASHGAAAGAGRSSSEMRGGIWCPRAAERPRSDRRARRKSLMPSLNGPAAFRTEEPPRVGLVFAEQESMTAAPTYKRQLHACAVAVASTLLLSGMARRQRPLRRPRSRTTYCAPRTAAARGASPEHPARFSTVTRITISSGASFAYSTLHIEIAVVVEDARIEDFVFRHVRSRAGRFPRQLTRRETRRADTCTACAYTNAWACRRGRSKAPSRPRRDCLARSSGRTGAP